jgi:hypothetical protein
LRIKEHEKFFKRVFERKENIERENTEKNNLFIKRFTKDSIKKVVVAVG